MLFFTILPVFFVSFTVISASSEEYNCTITQRTQVSGVLSTCDNIIVRNLLYAANRTLELPMRNGTTLTFDGAFVFGFAEWHGPAIKIMGNNITVRGSANHKLDGRGMRWWNGKGGPAEIRPTFLHIKATNSLIEDIEMIDCPGRCVDVDSKSLTIRNWLIDVSSGNPSPRGTILGKDTIGFNITDSSSLVLKNITVKNQADCVLVEGGVNLTFTNFSCYGGSGIGIVGGRNISPSRNVVRDVVFEDSNVINSTYGIHIRTMVDGSKGRISDVTFSNIQFSGVKNYGINVEQNYWNDGNSTGEPHNNVPISGLMIQGINGTMKGHDSVPVHILCARGGCMNFFWSNIHIRAFSKPNSCNYIPSGYHC
ncbi:hypothetical protein JTB14_028804 [Gonioctena quinquepunctata]|nr:hypothetical protein JTB14_028804 [Gonioctena quinquepunctata]